MKLTQKNMSNKEGFTLIEIIIVVIIVGILASLAVPKFTKQFKNAEAGEAFNIGGAFIRSWDRCAALTDTAAEAVADCASFGDLDMQAPVSAKFTYTVETANLDDATKCGAGTSYTIGLRSEDQAVPANYIYTCGSYDGSVEPTIVGYGEFANISSKI